MRAFFSTVDSILALTLALLLLFALCIQMPREEQLSLEAKVAYYEKVAEYVLLSSAMNGYIDAVIESFELGKTLDLDLERMLTLCPGRLSCLIEVRSPEGLALCSRGKNPISPSAVSIYFAATRLGLLRIICKVGSK